VSRVTFWIFAENGGGPVRVGVACSVVSDGSGDAVCAPDGLGRGASLRGPVGAAPSAPAEVPPPHAVAAATARSPR